MEMDSSQIYSAQVRKGRGQLQEGTLSVTDVCTHSHLVLSLKSETFSFNSLGPNILFPQLLRLTYLASPGSYQDEPHP